MSLTCLVALCSAALAPFSDIYGENRSFESRRKICLEVAAEAQSQGVDPFVMAAIGYVESGFTHSVNEKSGAAGPLQVLTKFWCQDSNCDLVHAGVFAYRSFSNNKNTMDSLCLYGSGYTCNRSKAGTRYAMKVLSSLERITHSSQMACEIDGC